MGLFELKDVLPRANLAIGSYRFAISKLIPEMTQVVLQTHEKDLMREIPSFAKEKFLYRLSRSDYEREWGKDYSKPGFFSRFDLTTADLRTNILRFYASLSGPITTKTDRKRWRRLLTDLDLLKLATPPVAGGFQTWCGSQK